MFKHVIWLLCIGRVSAINYKHELKVPSNHTAVQEEMNYLRNLLGN